MCTSRLSFLGNHSLGCATGKATPGKNPEEHKYLCNNQMSMTNHNDTAGIVGFYVNCQLAKIGFVLTCVKKVFQSDMQTKGKMTLCLNGLPFNSLELTGSVFTWGMVRDPLWVGSSVHLVTYR